MNYAPVMASQGPICGPGDCPIAAAFFDHGHIYGMVANLVAAGANLHARDGDGKSAKEYGMMSAVTTRPQLQ